MLEERTLAEEQMDDPALDVGNYAALLADLASVSTVTMGRLPTLDFLQRALKGRQSFRLLDVGFGHGDMLRTIADWAARYNLDVELVGIDLNAKSADVARAATPSGLPITYMTGDYASLSGKGFDFIVSSLVAHHMSHDQLIAFLRFMNREARIGWMINDLHRNALAYIGFPLLARIMRWHRIVREDGTLSIARSYRPEEWPPILAESGVSEARVYRAFPFRLCVEKI